MKPRLQYIIENLFDEIDEDKFNDWERKFINDMATRLDKLGGDVLESKLTDRQKEKLEELFDKED